MTPNVAHVWKIFNENIGIERLLESAELLCFSAKWLGEDAVEFYSVHQHGKESMVRNAHRLLDEADVVMGFNSKAFDVKHLNREFLLLGLNPPSPYQQIDLYLAVRSRFRFTSNKLDYVTRALGFEGKVKHEGHELWIKCMADDPVAWMKMAEYNKQDVILTEQLYYKLLPWIPAHPNKALIDGAGKCTRCGSNNLSERGFTHTGVSKFVQYQCLKCGGWQRETRRVAGSDIREVA